MKLPTVADIAVMDHSELDDALRATELEFRALAATRARILSAAATSGAHQIGGHRTVGAYIRATCNTGTATSKRDHILARLVGAHPRVADSLEAGHISIDHAHEIARIHTNARIGEILDSILASLLSMAEHLSLGEFRIQVGTIIGLADQDGAFQEQQHDINNRRAWIDDMSGGLHLTASGGDPLTAAQLTAVFESFAEGELQADLAARRAECGDSADAHPLPRTQSQRNFDALVAIFTVAAGSTEAGKLPEPTVNVIIDDKTLQDTLCSAGLILPSGNQINLGDNGDFANPENLLADLVSELAEDPDALGKRVCNLTTGAAIHPTVALRALLTGHVRRVVVDSRNTVTELGTRSRAFTGAAREAALLLTNFCTHKGCTIRARHSQVDHVIEWANGRNKPNQRPSKMRPPQPVQTQTEMANQTRSTRPHLRRQTRRHHRPTRRRTTARSHRGRNRRTHPSTRPRPRELTGSPKAEEGVSLSLVQEWRVELA